MSKGGTGASSEIGSSDARSTEPEVDGARGEPVGASGDARSTEAPASTSSTAVRPVTGRGQRVRSITELELRFAQNPASDVFVELCAAYLEKRRFMEAMVVCKKAIRTQPDATRPKLWLARVQEAQGRLPKAADALQELVAQAPDDPEVRLALGRVQLALDDAAGVDHLKRALDLDPGLEEATRLLEARSIVYPPPPPPPVSLPALPHAYRPSSPRAVTWPPTSTSPPTSA